MVIRNLMTDLRLWNILSHRGHKKPYDYDLRLWLHRGTFGANNISRFMVFVSNLGEGRI